MTHITKTATIINSMEVLLIAMLMTLTNYWGRNGGVFVVNGEHEVPTKKAMPPLMEPPPMLPEVTDKVWMEIAIDDEVIGKLEFGLFGTNSPKAVENFLTLSKCIPNNYGKLSKKLLCYKGSTFHRIIPNFAFQGGDITHGDGTGGESIYGGRYTMEDHTDQKELVKFTRRRLLANAGPNKQFGSQFFVTTVKAQWLTNKHNVFGMVLNDPNDEIITAIESVGTYGGRPKAVVQIVDVGIGTLTEEDTKPHY